MNNGSVGFAKAVLVVLAGWAGLSALLSSSSAEAAGGQCRWEGGPGAAGGHQYCKAEDCIGNGGLAQCSAGRGAVPDGWDDSELGPDKWLYSICGEWGPSIPLELRWCLAAGGGIQGTGCTNLPPTALHGNPTLAKDSERITELSRAYTDVSSHDSCPISLHSDTGWGATLDYISCGAGSTTYDMDTPVRMLRRIRWTAGGQCNNAVHTFTATMIRKAVCPTGYKRRNAVTGPECYMPAECCEAKAGNPVSVITGTKFHEDVDYRALANGGLQLSRYYKSSGYFRFPDLNVNPGPLDQMKVGDFWHHNYDSRLFVVSGNPEIMAIQQRADGSLRTFDTTGKEVANTPDGQAQLIVTANGYDVKLADDGVERFDASGRLVSILTREGMTTTLTYVNGQLHTVTDAFGHALTFTYDDGLLVSVALPDAGVIAYDYDDYDRLISVTYPDQSTRVYAYGDARNPWLLTSITDENNSVYATYSYNADGAVISESHANGADQYSFDYNPAYTEVTDPLGAKTYHTFSSAAGVMRKTAHSKPCLNCPGFNTRAFDAAGNLAEEIDFNNNRTIYVFDPVRNLETSRTEAHDTPIARTITTQWHPTFRLPTQVDEPGRRTAWSHDSRGNALTKTVTDTTTHTSRTWTYTYNDIGQVLSVDGPRTDVSDVITLTYHDCTHGYECGQLATLTDAEGNQTSYLTYDANGLPLTMSDANGVVTTLTYDARQRISSREISGELTSFTYYPTGLLRRVTLPDGSYVEHEYDAAHRLTGLTDGEGNRITYVLNAAGQRTLESIYDPSQELTVLRGRVYDELGRVLNESDAYNNATSFTYYGNGDVDTVIDPDLRVRTYAYDALNRQQSSIDAMNREIAFTYTARDELESVTDARGKTTNYQYNGFGDLTQLTSPDTGITRYVPNAAGNVHQATDARNLTATFSYDAAGRVTQIAYSDHSIHLTYDQGTFGKGRVTHLNDASGSTHWTYTAHGRVATREQTISSRTLTMIYGYNDAGQLSQLTTPSGQLIGYSYANGRPTGISINGSPLLSNVLYKPFGPVGGWNWANGTLSVREYDLNGRTTTIDSAGLSTYQYNPDGTIRSWTEDGNVPGGADGLTELLVDPNSNRLLSSTGAEVRTYSYDAIGNITGDGTRTFTYNGAGRMVSATGAGATATYAINGLGQRVRKSIGTAVTHFVYDEAGHLVGEYDSAGALIQETVWLGDIPVAVLKPNGGNVAVFYVHTDHLNTPRKITRPSDNTVVWSWVSDPFGATPSNDDPDNDGAAFVYNLRFPGQYFDTETGLHYNYRRDYDPAIGRYVQSDPIGLQGGVNSYAYALSNPTRNIDSKGLFSTADLALVGHFYSQRGGYVDISAWCGDYMADAMVKAQVRMLKRQIDATARQMASLKGRKDFSIKQRGALYVTSIYSFGAGDHHTQSADCEANGDGCCVNVNCRIRLYSVDQFDDPIDLCQRWGLCGPIRNIGGTPFWFGLSCSTEYGTVQCRK